MNLKFHFLLIHNYFSLWKEPNYFLSFFDFMHLEGLFFGGFLLLLLMMFLSCHKTKREGRACKHLYNLYEIEKNNHLDFDQRQNKPEYNKSRLLTL